MTPQRIQRKRPCKCGHDIGHHYADGPLGDHCRALVPNSLFSDGLGSCQCKQYREATA